MPLSGAVVIAQWVMTASATEQNSVLNAIEVVSDQNGDFRFEAWGPRFHGPLFALLGYDPQVIVFKRGYLTQVLSNARPRSPWTPVRKSDWDKQTIELEVFRAGEVERRRTIDLAVNSVLGASRDGYTFPLLQGEVRSELPVRSGSTHLLMTNLERINSAGAP